MHLEEGSGAHFTELSRVRLKCQGGHSPMSTPGSTETVIKHSTGFRCLTWVQVFHASKQRTSLPYKGQDPACAWHSRQVLLREQFCIHLCPHLIFLLSSLKSKELSAQVTLLCCKIHFPKSLCHCHVSPRDGDDKAVGEHLSHWHCSDVKTRV